MGSITLTVEGTTVGTVAKGGGIVVVKTVSEADSARLLMAYAAIYGPWQDENGDPITPTYQQIIERWWDGIIAGSTAAVKNQEQKVAAETAKAAVTNISVT